MGSARLPATVDEADRFVSGQASPWPPEGSLIRTPSSDRARKALHARECSHRGEFEEERGAGRSTDGSTEPPGS